MYNPSNLCHSPIKMKFAILNSSDQGSTPQCKITFLCQFTSPTSVWFRFQCDQCSKKVCIALNNDWTGFWYRSYDTSWKLCPQWATKCSSKSVTCARILHIAQDCVQKCSSAGDTAAWLWHHNRKHVFLFSSCHSPLIVTGRTAGAWAVSFAFLQGIDWMDFFPRQMNLAKLGKLPNIRTSSLFQSPHSMNFSRKTQFEKYSTKYENQLSATEFWCTCWILNCLFGSWILLPWSFSADTDPSCLMQRVILQICIKKRKCMQGRSIWTCACLPVLSYPKSVFGQSALCSALISLHFPVHCKATSLWLCIQMSTVPASWFWAMYLNLTGNLILCNSTPSGERGCNAKIIMN